MTLNKERGDLNFYVDSRVIIHITSNPSKMSQVVPYKGNGEIFVINEEPLRISIFFFDNRGCPGQLTNTLSNPMGP